VALSTPSAGAPSAIAIVHAPAREVADATAAHVARRVRNGGRCAIEARASYGAPLWRDVASRVGIRALASDPGDAARALVRALAQSGGVVVADLPALGTWDRAVLAALAALPTMPLAVFVTTSPDVTDDLRAEVYEVGATLDAAERPRWWAALAEAAQADVSGDSLISLEAWWQKARRARLAPPEPDAQLDWQGARLLSMLALTARAWHGADTGLLGVDEGTVDALVHAGAVRSTDGWIAIEAAWQGRAETLARCASDATMRAAARALSVRFEYDAWAQARAAELLVSAGAWEAADAAHTEALKRADGPMVRRDLVQRWMAALEAPPRPAQLALRVRATERALTAGEAEEAFRWAQSAAALAPDDPDLGLLLGRAAVILGDLVAAKVALERCRDLARDDAARAVIAAELAEVAYLSGDPATAADQANRALALDEAPGTRLKARNTLGKLLLASSSWDAADVHFAEDAWTASAAALPIEELRARLNRGIALLSKGLLDEARSMFESVYAEGERLGDARACAFALDNLSVVATLRHDYGEALVFSERTLKLRQALGDRVATARVVGNLADLRRLLGLLDHAEHAVAFGRRMLATGATRAPGIVPFSLRAARIALARGNNVEARREVVQALVETETAGMRDLVCEACCVAARVALEDGELARAGEVLERALALATTDEMRAEAALVAALHARASGDEGDGLGAAALAACRASGKEDLIIESHALLAEIHRAACRTDMARVHIEEAMALRDRVAATLPNDVRAAFIARPDLVLVAKLHALLSEPTASSDASSPSTRPSARPAPLVPREIVGDDPAIRGLLAAVKKVARANSTVLVRGESGTGKELVAEAIHRASDRANGPLVTVNCAALVETLLLSELFGHEKGAFTGAVARRRGRFEMAEGGTLFLDEIGDISPRTQVALLRVLQERTFERVGGTSPIRANVRIICATHRDLKAMVERGEFREDLYYRLRGITLEVPALRQRMGDLPRICDHLLARIAAERSEEQKTLSADALELLARHRWPGNIRELENTLRAASLFAEGDTITAPTLLDNVEDLRSVSALARGRVSLVVPVARGDALASDESTPEPAGEEDADPGDAPLPAAEASATAIAYSHVRAGASSLPDIKRQIERDCIARALAETKGNITRAAALLGMKRPRLSQLVKQYGLAAVSSEGS
jgi:transcriptional regulator with GAF, ATPase, and Fis domain/tetratricopeptide (TPR) repeat protein